MKNVLLILTVCVVALGSCKKPDSNSIDGVWVEQSMVSKFGGTKYRIRLNTDLTFQMKLNRFTDAIEANPVPCSGNRTDYVKGTYNVADGQILFQGDYCDETFNLIQANCQGATTYRQQFSYTFKDKDLLLDFEKEDYYKVRLVKQP